MRTATKLLLLSSLIIVFTSCQKEVDFQTRNSSGGTGGTGGTGNTNDIVGDYVTKSNIGTVKITSNQFITTGLGYSIDTVMNVKTYIDNVLFDDSDVPFVALVPSSSSTSPYVRISADSITVTGAMGVSPDPSGNTPTGPVGVKLSWSGDTLLLKVNSSFTQSITQGGVPGVITGSVNGITR